MEIKGLLPSNLISEIEGDKAVKNEDSKQIDELKNEEDNSASLVSKLA